jgi:hypothetical protein
MTDIQVYNITEVERLSSVGTVALKIQRPYFVQYELTVSWRICVSTYLTSELPLSADIAYTRMFLFSD